MRSLPSLLHRTVEERLCDNLKKTRESRRNDIRHFVSLTVWRTYDKRAGTSRNKYFTASAGKGYAGRTGRKARRKDTRGVCLPLNLKFPL